MNFDTLEDIRANSDLIRQVATGDTPTMPPTGVTWWWDRASLKEWLDAGLPGGSEVIDPLPVDDNKSTMAYEHAGSYLYKDHNAPETDRIFRIRPLSDEDTEVPDEHRVYLTKREDGTVVMTRQDRYDEETGTIRQDYSPAIPVLPSGGVVGAPDWYSTIQVRERHWSEATWREPDFETNLSEQWLVSTGGIEKLDNGVILPVQALKVVQSNLSTDVHTTWWFTKGLGVVRRQTDSPSLDYDREVVVEYNILEREDEPLRDPPYISYAMEEWFPFVGPYHTSERTDLDYGYQFDYQKIAVADGLTVPTATPTEPPLGPDPTQPVLAPTPSPTPFGYNPNPGTDGGGGNMSPSDPRISDLKADNFVDDQDLLIFLKHWHKSIP
jgi:hypothetical protein